VIMSSNRLRVVAGLSKTVVSGESRSDALTFNAHLGNKSGTGTQESRMKRTSTFGLLLPIAIGAGCQNRQRTDIFEAGEHSIITFQVDGMMKAKSGAT